MKAKNNEVSLRTDKIKSDQEEYHKYLVSLEGKKNYSELPEMDHNPFVCLLADDLTQKWVKMGKGGLNSTSVSLYTCNATGEEVPIRKKEGGILFEREVIVDQADFVKIFKSELKNMFSLSATALKLFLYFINSLDFKDHNGMVYMSMEDGMNYCEYGENSRSLVYRGLIELILKGFICKTDRPWTFFVNPKFAFNGDRVATFTEYRLQSSDNMLKKLNGHESDK